MCPRFYSIAFMALSGLRWCAGHNPVFLLRQCGARIPSFPFLEKEKRGEKRKSLTNRRAGKEHVESILSYQPECALAPKGAIVRIYAYQPGKRVLFPRYERASRVIYLGAYPSCTIPFGLTALRR